MSSLGSIVRRAFGPYERQVSELYRSMFINLDDLATCIRDWSNPGAILEIGCGEGALAERLVRDFPDAAYTGIDITPTLGRLYEGPMDNVTFQQITAERLAEEKPGSFDLVIMNDVLHHVESGSRTSIMDAARDLLAPQGTMIFKDWVRRPTPIHAAVYFADAYIGGDKNVRYMPMDEQLSRIGSAFGDAAIKSKRSIKPWSQNLAFCITPAASEAQNPTQI